MPFTEAIAEYVRAQAHLKSKPAPTVLLVLGVAAVIPLLFSVAFIFQGTLFTYGTAIIWTVFLGIGALAAYGVLQETARFRRDFAGGVYLRWTGAFTIRVISSRYGSAGQVQAGGRKLSNEAALALKSHESGTGTVDYLPVSGRVLEVRGPVGRLVWARFPDH